MPEVKINELTFLVDTREQLPWNFSRLVDPLTKIPYRQEKATLETCDYSVKGFPVFCERKSLPDLLGVCGQSRPRFEDELRRMQEIFFQTKIAPCVIVESSWEDCMRGDWAYSKITPNVLKGSVFGWSQWGIPFHFLPNRIEAAKACLHYLFLGARRIQREIDARTF